MFTAAPLAVGMVLVGGVAGVTTTVPTEPAQPTILLTTLSALPVILLHGALLATKQWEMGGWVDLT